MSLSPRNYVADDILAEENTPVSSDRECSRLPPMQDGTNMEILCELRIESRASSEGLALPIGMTGLLSSRLHCLSGPLRTDMERDMDG